MSVSAFCGTHIYTCTVEHLFSDIGSSYRSKPMSVTSTIAGKGEICFSRTGSNSLARPVKVKATLAKIPVGSVVAATNPRLYYGTSSNIPLSIGLGAAKLGLSVPHGQGRSEGQGQTLGQVEGQGQAPCRTTEVVNRRSQESKPGMDVNVETARKKDGTAASKNNALDNDVI